MPTLNLTPIEYEKLKEGWKRGRDRVHFEYNEGHIKATLDMLMDLRVCPKCGSLARHSLSGAWECLDTTCDYREYDHSQP